MNIEEFCEKEIPVTVHIGDDYSINGTIVEVGVMPGHMARIGFALKTDPEGKIHLINEPCTISTECEV